MPDIFDTLAPEQEPQSGDIFDQIAEPKGDIFDQISEQSQPSDTPETDSALKDQKIIGTLGKVLNYFDLQKQAQPPEQRSTGAKVLEGAGKGLKELIPQSVGGAARMVGEAVGGPLVGAAENLYQTGKDVSKVASGAPIEETFQEKPFTQYTAEDWGRFVAQRGVDAAMAIPLFKGLRPEVRANIIQKRGETDAIQRSDAQIQARETPLGIETRPESGIPSPGDSDYVKREAQGKAGELPQEQPVPAGESVAPATSEEPNAPRSLEADLSQPSGISTERLQELYGKDAVIINKGKGAKAWQAAGEADKRDPYVLLTQARRRGIAPPEDVAKLRNEHQKLLSAARQSYGTPAYPQLAQYAADFANAVKSVAHGPASDVMRALQESDVPKYDSPADFDSIIRERMQRESTPKEQETFGKISNELKNGDTEVKKTASDAQNRLKRYLPKDEVSFEQAVDHVRKQIQELTKPCQL